MGASQPAPNLKIVPPGAGTGGIKKKEVVKMKEKRKMEFIGKFALKKTEVIEEWFILLLDASQNASQNLFYVGYGSNFMTGCCDISLEYDCDGCQHWHPSQGCKAQWVLAEFEHPELGLTQRRVVPASEWELSLALLALLGKA